MSAGTGKRALTLLAVAALSAVAAGATGGTAAAGMIFTVTNTKDTGAGSLRQAILDANANAGSDTIQFAVGNGVQIINVTSVALPSISDPVTIDGTTQPGFAGIPLIRIKNNTGKSTTNGIDIPAGSSTVRGLDIVGFQYGISIESGGG